MDHPLLCPVLCLLRSASPLWHRCQEGRREKGGEDGRRWGVQRHRKRKGVTCCSERRNRKRRSPRKELRLRVCHRKTRKQSTRRNVNCREPTRRHKTVRYRLTYTFIIQYPKRTSVHIPHSYYPAATDRWRERQADPDTSAILLHLTMFIQSIDFF